MKKIKKYPLVILSFIKKKIKEIIAILMIVTYIVITYLIWFVLKDELSEFKDVITLQIQGTGLLIGLVAASIGIFNFWRKSGVKLLITMDSNIFRHIIFIRNLKDKEIIIFNLYLCLIINKKKYMLDVLSSSIDSQKELVLKAYGHKDLEMRLPVAIKIEKRYKLKYLGNFKNPEDRYIYVKPLINDENSLYNTKFNNIILYEIRNQKKLKYIAETSAGTYISSIKKLDSMYIKNKLSFCDRKKIIGDYCDFYEERILASTPEDKFFKIDPENIEDESLDKFLREYETKENALKVNKENL